MAEVPGGDRAANEAAFRGWMELLNSLGSRFPDAFRGWAHPPGNGDHVVISIVESAPGAADLRAAVAAAEQRSLDLSGLSFTVTYEAKTHTTADLREIVQELNVDAATNGPLSKLRLTGAGMGRDGIVLFAPNEAQPAILAAAQDRYPGVEFEIPPPFLSAQPRHTSPEAAAETLRERLASVLDELARHQMTTVDAIRAVNDLSDEIVSQDLGVRHGGDDYMHAQLLVLDERAQALQVIAETSNDPLIADYAAHAREVLSLMREHGPIDFARRQPRELPELVARGRDIEVRLGLTRP